MLYTRPQIFLKANGSFGKGGGGGASTSYEGTSKGVGNSFSFDNPGYDKIKDLPVGAEFTVSSSRLSLGARDVRYKVLMVNGERQLVIMNNNGQRDLVYNSAATADTSHFSRNITDADLRRLVGDDAVKITIHNGGKPINSRTRDSAEQAYHELLRSGQELGRTEYNVYKLNSETSMRRTTGGYTTATTYEDKTGINAVLNIPDRTYITVNGSSLTPSTYSRNYFATRDYQGKLSLTQVDTQGRHLSRGFVINNTSDITRRLKPQTIIIHGRDLDQEARADARLNRETERNIKRQFREMKARQRQFEQNNSTNR